MAKVSGIGLMSSVDLYASDTIAQHIPGAIVWDGNSGKAFRYVLVGASALVAGNTLQEAAVITTNTNMVVATAGKVGDAFLAITNGTSTITSAGYVGGTIGIYTSGTNLIGDEYTITAITGTLTTGGALQVYLDRPLRYATSTSATVNMLPSPWANVIQSTGTTATGMPAGVAIFALPAATYGWVQTHGQCDVLCDATTMAVGSDLALSITVAGAAGLYAVTSGRARIGYTRQANASGKGIMGFLQID